MDTHSAYPIFWFLFREMEVQLDEAEPLNFCKIDLRRPLEQIAQEFPKFPSREPCQECTVEEGSMLYLPAGEIYDSNLQVAHKP